MSNFEKVQKTLLRIYISESAKFNGKTLYRELIERAHSQGIAGTTVIQGLMGYGMDKKIHTSALIDLSNELPVLIEVIDTPEAINNFLEGSAADIIKVKGLITLEEIQTVQLKN
jgi:PII-like signaling protein